MTIFIIIVSNDSVLFKWGLSEGMCCDKLKVFSVVLLGKDCTRFQYLRSVWFTGFENFGWVREIFCFRWHTTK